MTLKVIELISRNNKEEIYKKLDNLYSKMNNLEFINIMEFWNETTNIINKILVDNKFNEDINIFSVKQDFFINNYSYKKFNKIHFKNIIKILLINKLFEDIYINYINMENKITNREEFLTKQYNALKIEDYIYKPFLNIIFKDNILGKTFQQFYDYLIKDHKLDHNRIKTLIFTEFAQSDSFNENDLIYKDPHKGLINIIG
jgi:hypothetical protein